MNAHSHDLSPWQHSHVFDPGNRRGEAGTQVVLVVTLATMVAEIAGGWLTGSMALLADGWHMGTHALALGVASLAYALARRQAGDARYAFGTWKIEVLGSFASALVLGMVALAIAFESALRLWKAEPISAQAALVVAVIGLLVNGVSAWLLHGAGGGHHQHQHQHQHHHGHHGDADPRRPHRSVHAPVPGGAHADAAIEAGAHVHGHSHGHVHSHDADHDRRHGASSAARPHGPAGHAGHSNPDEQAARAAASSFGTDLNLRAAYVHVLADALTSVLAIGALAGALWIGWWWLDPLVGVLGAMVIGVWSIGLMRDSSAVLLDREMDHPLTQRIRATLESDGDAKVADLHVWRVGRSQFAAIACLVADRPLAPAAYRQRLAAHDELVHVSLEVNRCQSAA